VFTTVQYIFITGFELFYTYYAWSRSFMFMEMVFPKLTRHVARFLKILPLLFVAQVVPQIVSCVAWNMGANVETSVLLDENGVISGITSGTTTMSSFRTRTLSETLNLVGVFISAVNGFNLAVFDGFLLFSFIKLLRSNNATKTEGLGEGEGGGAGGESKELKQAARTSLNDERFAIIARYSVAVIGIIFVSLGVYATAAVSPVGDLSNLLALIVYFLFTLILGLLSAMKFQLLKEKRNHGISGTLHL
ncbi:UNVERIFIED_CONTAM: hypothetical protein HDU68_006601, partial [Siphonaria sp. JEL0065]